MDNLRLINGCRALNEMVTLNHLNGYLSNKKPSHTFFVLPCKGQQRISSVLRREVFVYSKQLKLNNANTCCFGYLYTFTRQGSKGIRQWPINWCISRVMMHKIPFSVDYNYWTINLMRQPIKIQKSPKLLS